MKPPRFFIGHWEVTIRFLPGAWLLGVVVERFEGRTISVSAYPLPMLQFMAWRL